MNLTKNFAKHIFKHNQSIDMVANQRKILQRKVFPAKKKCAKIVTTKKNLSKSTNWHPHPHPHPQDNVTVLILVIKHLFI